jgi:hypothetical protein
MVNGFNQDVAVDHLKDVIIEHDVVFEDSDSTGNSISEHAKRSSTHWAAVSVEEGCTDINEGCSDIDE